VQLLSRLRRYLKDRSGFEPGDRFNGVETKTGTLDVHRMKTLCREVRRIVDEKRE
jgi:hypothetical protein